MRFLKDPRKIATEYKPEFANPDVSVLGGVVSYSPDIERFEECLTSIVDQVDQLIVVDNGSENFEQILNLINKINAQKCSKKTSVFTRLSNKQTGDISKVFILKYDKNCGIAQALRDIMDFAISQNFEWVLTLDDDSVAMPELVENYKRFTAMPKLATMTCLKEDRNYDRGDKSEQTKFEYLYRCITSGCFMNVDAYKQIDGYDIDFFIDRVDDDICHQLTKAGFKHIRLNYVGLLHEMGHGDIKHVLWHRAKADNYNQMRNYYIFRNEYILRKKHPELCRIEWLQSGRPMWVNFALLSLKVLLYEDNKSKKISAMRRGWHDGKKYIRNKQRGNVVK